MRYLAIDLGDKRTGLAVGDSITGVAVPLDVLEVPASERAGVALLDALAAAITNQLGTSPGELVLGLPLNMDGTDSPRAKLARDFAVRLAERTGRVVHLHDERLSSAAADWTMSQSGLTHAQKKARRDALAAAAVLTDFLKTLPRPPS